MSLEETLHKVLRSLPDHSFDKELDFMRQVVPAFVKLLGYSESETFYEYAAGRGYADVVLSSAVTSTPWIVIEIKSYKPKNVGDWIYSLKRYLTVLNCSVGVVISPELLVLSVRDEVKRFDLRSIDIIETREILSVLDRSSQPSTTEARISPTSRLIELIEAVEKATTNEKKGETLEALARFLFDSVPSLKCKYLNLQTKSSEIDLVIEYDHSKGQIGLLEELGRYCLVECKNWSKPVGVAPVRDFMGKLDKCKTRLGIIFSKNGVTGVDSGADALREIQSRFDRDGVYLLVFSLEDLKGIKSGEAFIESIDQKADSLRFDAEGC